MLLYGRCSGGARVTIAPRDFSFVSLTCTAEAPSHRHLYTSHTRCSPPTVHSRFRPYSSSSAVGVAGAGRARLQRVGFSRWPFGKKLGFMQCFARQSCLITLPLSSPLFGTVVHGQRGMRAVGPVEHWRHTQAVSLLHNMHRYCLPGFHSSPRIERSGTSSWTSVSSLPDFALAEHEPDGELVNAQLQEEEHRDHVSAAFVQRA